MYAFPRYIILPHPLWFSFMLSQSKENCTVRVYDLDLTHNSNSGYYKNAWLVFSGQWTLSAFKVQSSASFIYNATINKTVVMRRKIETRDNYLFCLTKLLIKDILFCCLILIFKEITVGSSHSTFQLISHFHFFCCCTLSTWTIKYKCYFLLTVNYYWLYLPAYLCSIWWSALKSVLFFITLSHWGRVDILCSVRNYKGQRNLHMTSEMFHSSLGYTKIQTTVQ